MTADARIYNLTLTANSGEDLVHHKKLRCCLLLMEAELLKVIKYIYILPREQDYATK